MIRFFEEFFLFRFFRRPEGLGVALADDDSPGVVLLYESSMLKNNRSAGITGEAPRTGDPTTDDGLVDGSGFVSDKSKSSFVGGLAWNRLATAKRVNAASPPAAATVIPADSFIDSIIRTPKTH